MLKRHLYTGNLDRETSGDSKNVLVLCEDVSELVEWLGTD